MSMQENIPHRRHCTAAKNPYRIIPAADAAPDQFIGRHLLRAGYSLAIFRRLRLLSEKPADISMSEGKIRLS
jgi:hypothetical protein